MPPTPSLTQAFSALGNWLKKPTGIAAPGVPSAPRVGVSSPSALGLPSGAPAVPMTNPAVASSEKAAGTSVGGMSIPNPSGGAGGGAYVPYPQGGGGAYTPYGTGGTGGMSIPTPAAPQAPNAPNATSAETGLPVYNPPPAFKFKPAVPTPSGAMADPNTGAVTSATPAPAVAQVQPAPLTISSNTGNIGSVSSYSGSAGGSPAASSFGGGYGGRGGSAYDDYLKSLKPSNEEDEAQRQLDELAAASATGLVNIQNQPIALPFITGQQAAVERSAALRGMPIEARLARLQAKRTMAQTAGKAALDYEESKAKAEREGAFTLGEGQQRYDAAGNLVAGAPAAGGAGVASPEALSWVNLIKGGQAQLSDVPSNLRNSVAESLSTSPLVSRASQKAIQEADTVLTTLDNLEPLITGLTTGFTGARLANVENTDAYRLAKQLDTVKAVVGFSALQAMRDASPTGGALGQVSERENTLLQSTLASLDQFVGEDQLRTNLARVRLHMENLKKLVAAPPGSQASYDANGSIVITGAGAFGGEGTSGSIYDF